MTRVKQAFETPARHGRNENHQVLTGVLMKPKKESKTILGIQSHKKRNKYFVV